MRYHPGNKDREEISTPPEEIYQIYGNTPVKPCGANVAGRYCPYDGAGSVEITGKPKRTEELGGYAVTLCSYHTMVYNGLKPSPLGHPTTVRIPATESTPARSVTISNRPS